MEHGWTEVLTINNLDVAGILTTYALKASNARDTKQLRNIVRDLKMELDLRRVKMDGGADSAAD